MKHLYIIFLALLACCPEVIHAENEISYLPKSGYRTGELSRKAEKYN